MRLGIDFGTTRTIVAQVDRGNYPVVGFLDNDGDAVDHVPTVAARVGDRVVYGFEAMAAAEAGAPLLRSFKRELASSGVRPSTMLDVGGLPITVVDLLTGFLQAVRATLATESTLAGSFAEDEPLEAMVAVPAHAHSAQRFITLEAFRRAGFQVVGMINEPSAAGFEFTHRQPRSANSRRTKVVVYDLGGGTFDASLVRVDDLSHHVEDSVGINVLGGDDFDEVLLACAQREVGGHVALTPAERASLLEECRVAKENLSPQSRRIALEVAHAPVVVEVADYYAAAAPLVEASIDVLAPLVGGLDAGHLGEAEVAGIYLVGGASGLPLVARMLRERFGRRVHRSPHPAASTAIGLAIAADPSSGFHLTDQLSRGFGVFREWDGGRSVSFDPILDRRHATSPDADVVVTRRYRPEHNVGIYSFVEHSDLGESGEPTGDVVPAGEILFPYDRTLRDGRDLTREAVHRTGPGPLVEERYTVDRHGIIEARITDLEDGYSQVTSLGR